MIMSSYDCEQLAKVIASNIHNATYLHVKTVTCRMNAQNVTVEYRESCGFDAAVAIITVDNVEFTRDLKLVKRITLYNAPQNPTTSQCYDAWQLARCRSDWNTAYNNLDSMTMTRPNVRDIAYQLMGLFLDKIQHYS